MRQPDRGQGWVRRVEIGLMGRKTARETGKKGDEMEKDDYKREILCMRESERVRKRKRWEDKKKH